MTNLDDLEHVVRLAALTENRSADEQRALLRVACRVELERNTATSRNLVAWAPRDPCTIVDDVEAYEAFDDDRPVRLAGADRERLARRRERWRTDSADFAAGRVPS